MMSIINLWMVVTNLGALFPLIKLLGKGDYITFSFLVFVSSMSFFSHLIENHKHGMSGIGFSQQTSYFFNRMDVLGCFLFIGRLLFLDLNLDFNIIFMSVIAILILFISEYDKYNPELQISYLVSHSVWHIMIYNIIYYVI